MRMKKNCLFSRSPAHPELRTVTSQVKVNNIINMMKAATYDSIPKATFMYVAFFIWSWKDLEKPALNIQPDRSLEVIK